MEVENFILCIRAFIGALPMILYLVVLQKRRTERSRRRKRKRDGLEEPKYLILDRISERMAFIERITQDSNREYFRNLRMCNQGFVELCRVLKAQCGLKDDQYVSVVEKMAIFLRTLAHYQKNRILQIDFQRSGHTISVVFHEVLMAVLQLGSSYLAQPIPVDESTTDKRWKCFKGCVGALDGIYIPLHVPVDDQSRYRARKGHLATNVLGLFIYMLVGWEGSAADSRVLSDAVTRPNGLMVQRGTYYLCDSGYTNGEGFLTPFRQTRYHLQEWGPGNRKPQDYKDLFNLCHASARNVIERAFGILKKHFAVLRSPSFYPLKTQCDIILACSLLHNFDIKVIPQNPLLRSSNTPVEETVNDTNVADEHIQSVNSSPGWNQFREQLATGLWENYMQQRNRLLKCLHSCTVNKYDC